MKKSRSVVGIAVVISSLVLVAASVISYRAVTALANSGSEVLRAKELELSLERLLSTLRDAETGQRGFLLSGEEAYLKPYTDALRELDARLVTVEARLEARGGSAEQLQPLRALVDRKLDELARTLALYREGKREAALAVVRSDEGKFTMDGIRSYVGERSQLEQRNVERLLGIEADALRATVRATIAVGVLAIVLMVLLAWVVRRDSMRLRLSEERLLTTLRSIGDAVIATDEQGLVTLTNPVADRLTGWPLAEARGRPLEEIFRIVNEQTRATVESPVTKVLREGGIVGLANHTVLIHKAGHETPIEDSGAPISDDEGVTTGVVLVFRDATHERAVRNELEAADRRKDEFLAILAHELRNPLAPIRQAAAMVARPDSTPEQVGWSHAVIERQSAHMARLLDDLLDVSRITRGRLEVRRKLVSLREVVDSAVETARPSIDALGHALQIELPAEDTWLDADALRISQVLANLLTNAAKYTPPPGNIRLLAASEGGFVKIRVVDSGIGLAPEDLPRIFDMFAQVKPTLDRKEAGLGIGLALSKALVALHGGTLEARSGGAGKGSEFTVTLARAEAPPVSQPAPVTAEASQASAPAPLRVFIADDNRDAADSLEMLLTLDQHEVRVAYDGERAFEAMAAFAPRIALLDIGMPGMNGYELAARIRQQPWGKSIHLVALTGWGQEGDRRRALEAGFNEHSVKPVDFAVLGALCRRIAAAGN